MVVPRMEVDHWIDLDAEAWSHISAVAQRVGKAIQAVYNPLRVGMSLVGTDVPHVHIHVTAISSGADLGFGTTRRASQDELAVEAEKIREALERL